MEVEKDETDEKKRDFRSFNISPDSVMDFLKNVEETINYIKKIEREIISPRKNSSYILSNSKSDILHRANIIINNSSSKAMYSFPLSKRFKKDIDDNSTFFYNKPSTLNQRKAFIGYGSRSTILLSKSGKTDNYYNIPPTINANANTGCPKYTFGYSWAVCRKPKCLDQRETPGPSSYFPYKKFGQSGLK